MNPADRDDWHVEVFYDGECPLCTREIRLLQRLDRRRRIRFTNVAHETFEAASYGLTMREFMDEIQGRLRDGSWITGVEVFRQLYSAVGFGALVRATRLPGAAHALNLGYRLFARNRLRLTGRCAGGTCRA
ncbi:MAG: DUF393 domain-containing protein [Planctomycetales bacterium]|nr:DUF393 domain-containing protein [Planctomycetales bacterium]